MKKRSVVKVKRVGRQPEFYPSAYDLRIICHALHHARRDGILALDRLAEQLRMYGLRDQAAAVTLRRDRLRHRLTVLLARLGGGP